MVNVLQVWLLAQGGVPISPTLTPHPTPGKLQRRLRPVCKTVAGRLLLTHLRLGNTLPAVVALVAGLAEAALIAGRRRGAAWRGALREMESQYEWRDRIRNVPILLRGPGPSRLEAHGANMGAKHKNEGLVATSCMPGARSRHADPALELKQKFTPPTMQIPALLHVEPVGGVGVPDGHVAPVLPVHSLQSGKKGASLGPAMQPTEVRKGG